MSQVEFGCSISSTDPSVPLSLEIWLDQKEIYNNNITEPVKFSYQFEDIDGDRQFQFRLKNKLPEHTQLVNDQIVKDVVINISNIVIDDISVDLIFQKLAKYHHDFNGSSAPTVDRFYGQLGCNGTVTLAFTGPIFVWLLEHM